jgi:peptidoglycan/xylan/chitin deacetylase (PgdA/CDA1 family)
MDRDVRRQCVNFSRYAIGSLFILLGKPLLNRQLTTFVFHEVSNTPRSHAQETRTYSDLKTFEKQIEWIQKSFEVRNLLADDALDGGCVITFDDGYAGLVENALPILEARGIPAVCFINMVTINGEVNSSALAMHVANRERRPVEWKDSNPRFYSHALEKLSDEDLEEIRGYQGPYLNIQQLERLSNSPLITIGDHLYNHWLLDSLTPEELSGEMAKSSNALQSFNSYRRIFAAPHGASSLAVLDYLMDSGFQLVFSGKEIHRVGTMSVYPRIDLNNEIANVQQFFGAVVISKLRILTWRGRLRS